MVNLNALLSIFIWLILVFVIALICKREFPNKKELTRKIIHIGTGPIIPLAWWLDISKELAIIISSIITIGLLINYKFRLVGVLENIERKSYGTFIYGLSITLLILFLWPQNRAALSAGILVMAFGDGLAGLIGKGFKSKNWKIFGQQKSLYGTLTMGIVSILILSCIGFISKIDINLFQITFIALIATTLEQISILGIDNFTVPLGVALTFIWITNL